MGGGSTSSVVRVGGCCYWSIGGWHGFNAGNSQYWSKVVGVGVVAVAVRALE